MPRLYDQIRDAVKENRVIASWHADDTCEDRNVTVWQLAAGMDEAILLRERPASRPNPSVVVRQTLPDGQEVQVVWAWLSRTRRAKLVTVYFPD